MKINYERGAKPNKFTLKPNELEYNIVDKKLYTIGKFGEVIEVLDTEAISNLITANANALSAHKNLNIMRRYDTAKRIFGTTYADGKEWDIFTKTAGTNVILSWRCPFRNNSTSWGGGYIDILLSIDGGAYASIGDSGYDGGVMVDGKRVIGSMSGTLLLDLNAVRNATSIRIKFRHRSYNGIVIINGDHNIRTRRLGAFWSQITLQEVEANVI